MVGLVSLLAVSAPAFATSFSIEASDDEGNITAVVNPTGGWSYGEDVTHFWMTDAEGAVTAQNH